jgi:peroxiredoxin Q/BCP
MARGYRDQFPAMKELGAVVIAVGPGTCESHAQFKTERLLPFIMIVDEDNRIAKQYNAFGTVNLDGTPVESPIRSHFLIAEDGMILAMQTRVGATESAKLAIRALSRFSS